MMKAFHNAVLFFLMQRYNKNRMLGGNFYHIWGQNLFFQHILSQKYPSLNDFYHLTHLFSRSKSKEKELKNTITTISMKLSLH